MAIDSVLDPGLYRLDDYGLAHLFSHLYSLRRIDKYRQAMYALICQPFMRLKLDHTQSPDSFVQDVSMAIEVASSEEPPNLVQLTRLSLINATLVVLTENVPVEVLGALAYLNDIKRAKGYLTLLSGQEQQFQASCLIADAFVSMGMKRDALEELEKAKARIEGAEDQESRRLALGNIVATLVKAGAEFDQIKEYILAIGEPRHQVKTLKTIAELYVSLGSLELAADAAKEALDLSKTIEPSYDVRRIDSVRAGSDSWSHVTTTFSVTDKKNKRTSDWEKAEALYEISVAFAEISDYDQALKIAAKIGSKAPKTSFVNFWEDAYPEVLVQWYRAKALGDITSILTQQKQKDFRKQAAQEALVAANVIREILSSRIGRESTGDRDRRWPMLDTGLDLDQWGPSDDDIKWPMIDALAIAAVALAEAGELKQSQKTLIELETLLKGFSTMSAKIAGTVTSVEWSINETLLRVSRAFFAIGDLESAKRNAILVFKNIKDGGQFIEAEQAQNLIRLVPLLVMLKLSEKTIAEMVLEAIYANNAERKKIKELLEVTRSLYEYGYDHLGFQLLVQSSEMAGRMRNKSIQIDIKSKIALLLAANDQSAKARELIDDVLAKVNLREEAMKYSTMCRIAQGLIEVGMLEEALDLVQLAKKGSRRFSALLERIEVQSLVAQSLVRLGKQQEASELADDALRLAERSKIYRLKANALSFLIPAYASLGAKAQGKKIATQALKAAKRLKGQQKIETLAQTISGMVSTGDLERAKKVPDQIISKRDRATLFMFLAQESFSKGLVELSQNVMLKALGLAKTISKPTDRLLALSHASANLAAIGRLTESKETFDSVFAKLHTASNEQVRSNAAGYISISLAYLGDISNSISLAGSIEDESLRSWTLGEISTILARSGKWEESLRVYASAFTTTRHITRENVFELIGSHSSFLAELDQGQTLWQIYQAIQVTDSWWGQELFGSATH